MQRFAIRASRSSSSSCSSSSSSSSPLAARCFQVGSSPSSSPASLYSSSPSSSSSSSSSSLASSTSSSSLHLKRSSASSSSASRTFCRRSFSVATRSSSLSRLSTPSLFHEGALIDGKWILASPPSSTSSSSSSAASSSSSSFSSSSASATSPPSSRVSSTDASSSSSPIAVHNPSTGDLLGFVPSLSSSSIQAAILSASSAQESWASETGARRGALLQRFYDLMREHENDLALLMSLEQGKPLAEARGEIRYAAEFLRVFSVEASRQFGEIVPSPVKNSRILITYSPVGVVGAITPWNFPAAMITRKVGAALAAGCCVVLKPSELTPFSALALGDLALQAGFPPGALQIVTGDAAMIGKAFTSSPLVRKIAFTGSTRVGKLLMADASASVKRMSMELGGNAAFLVFKDAQLNEAIEGAVACKFRNNGQTCVTANRFIVHSSLYEEFVKRLSEKVSALKVGDGLSEGVATGPLINEAAVLKVEAHVRDALSKGAKVMTGGKRLTRQDFHTIPAKNTGFFYAPTVVRDATPDMLAFREETFGPTAFVFRFEDEDEAISMANDTNAGLASYAYTENSRLMAKLMDKLQYGMIALNQPTVSVPSAPFGGMKESGMGREGSHHGLKDYLDMKTIHIAV